MQSETIPPTITRPLRLAALSIILFLIGFSAWAVFAPLSSTLHLSGHIISSRPTIDLQHPYGGRVGQVFVTRHDAVTRGQILFQMDTALEEEQLAALERVAAIYRSENQVIDRLLAAQDTGPLPDAADRQSPHAHRRQQAILQSNLQRENTAHLEQQAGALARKISLTEQQLTLMRGRQDRQSNLAGKGLISLSDGEVLKERILIVQSEIEEDRASLASLQGQAVSSEGNAELTMLSLREHLLRTRDDNIKRLEDTQRHISELRDRIRQAVVRSPVDGTVAELHFETTGMYAGLGKTLISLTQPLEQPMVSFDVPVAQIDQLSAGMQGRLVLTSLPQRAMPRVDLEVIAISPRATEDQNGTPVSYKGMARISPASMDRLLTSLDALQLTEDMPAQLLIDARTTTLSQYILDPFLASFRKSLQD